MEMIIMNLVGKVRRLRSGIEDFAPEPLCRPH